MLLRKSKKGKNFQEKEKNNKKKSEKDIFSYLLIFLIILYQNTISPLFGHNCRFIPTCSSYSKNVIRKYGLIKGIILSIKRICKCHPWNKGGYDPAP